MADVLPPGAELAPGNRATLDAPQDEERRPPLPRDALPPDLVHHMPVRPFISIRRTHLSGIGPGGEQQQVRPE